MNRLGRYMAGLKPFGLMAGAILWIVWFISIALGTGNLDRNGQVIGTDHTAFHTAAQLLQEGRGSELFDFPSVPAIATRQDEITGKPGFLDPFRNPPLYAVLYIPTARLPYLASYAIWAVIGLLSFTAGVALVCGRKCLKAVLWSLSFYPVFAAVSFGQNSLLSAGIFGLVYHCLTHQRLFVAGLSAGLLCYKPQLLLGLGAWWLLGIRRYWPSLCGLFLGSAAFAGISFAVVPEATNAFIQNLPELARYDAFEFYNLHNPRGFGALLTGNKQIGNWLGVAGLILTVIWLVRFWRRHANDFSLMFAAAIFATLMGSPHTLVYEWSLVVLSACIIWKCRPNERPQWIALSSLAWAALFISTPFTKWQLDVTCHAVQLSVPVLIFIAIAIEKTLSRPGQCGT